MQFRKSPPQCKEFFKRAQFYNNKKSKNGNFFSQKIGIKRAKLKNFNQKELRFQIFFLNFFLEIFLILLPIQMDFFLTL